MYFGLLSENCFGTCIWYISAVPSLQSEYWVYKWIKPRPIIVKKSKWSSETKGFVFQRKAPLCSVAESSNERKASKSFLIIGKIDFVLMIPFENVPMMKLQNIAFQWKEVLLLPKCDIQRTHHKMVQNPSPKVRLEWWLVDICIVTVFDIKCIIGEDSSHLLCHILISMSWKFHSVCAILSYHSS